MELRKSTKSQSQEFQTLLEKLGGLGLYEKGMNLEEMRQVMGAVHESINETSFNEQDIECALRESEQDFECANIYNSTMVGSAGNTSNSGNSSLWSRNLRAFSSPFSSPEVSCVQKVTVVAEVHHELNWTPKRPQRAKKERKFISNKRAPDAISQDDSGVILSSCNLYETTSV